MRLDAHRRLTELSTATGKEYGKLVQKLLAIGFLDAGVDAVTERAIQGIDLEIDVHGQRYAFEVKTTEQGAVKLGSKDIEGLKARLTEGTEAYLAVLGSGLLDEWVFARFYPGELQAARNYTVFDLRPYRNRELEDLVCQTFADAVMKHAREALLNRQSGLNRILQGFPAYRLA